MTIRTNVLFPSSEIKLLEIEYRISYGPLKRLFISIRWHAIISIVLSIFSVWESYYIARN
jgi:hypothetical protein